MRSKYLCALQPPLFLETFIHLSVVKWLPISINTSKFLRVPIIIINNQFAKRQIRLNLRFSLVTLMLSSSTKVTWRLVRLLLKTKCHDNLFCWNVWLAWCHRRKTERWKNRKASFVILRSKSVEHFWKFLIEIADKKTLHNWVLFKKLILNFKDVALSWRKIWIYPSCITGAKKLD